MDINPHLVAGFATAIDSFSQTLIARKQSIESLRMTELKLRLSTFNQGNLTMIVFFNIYDSVEIIDSIIFDLQTQFLERFGHMNLLQSHDLNIFRTFDSIIESLSSVHLNIGFLSQQSEYKAKLWNLFSEFQLEEKQNEAKNEKNTRLNLDYNLNVIQIHDPALKSCMLSVWNFDIESIERKQVALQDTHLFLITVEPNFDFLQNLLAKIEFLRKNYPNSHISGIIISEKGEITKSNCELILQIPTFEISLNDTLIKEKIAEIVRNITFGIEI